jgi:hypothetical protein
VIASVFEDLCKSIWEHQPEDLPTHTQHIATRFFDSVAKINGLADAGVFAVTFIDGSVALCGSRGSSIIATISAYDHCDPESHEAIERGVL